MILNYALCLPSALKPAAGEEDYSAVPVDHHGPAYAVKAHAKEQSQKI